MLLFVVQVILKGSLNADELAYAIPVQLPPQSPHFRESHFDPMRKIFDVLPNQAGRNSMVHFYQIASFVDRSPILGLEFQSCTIKLSNQTTKRAAHFCGSTATPSYILEIKGSHP